MLDVTDGEFARLPSRELLTCSRGRVVAIHQLWEELENLSPRCCTNEFERLRSGIKGLGFGAVGHHDLMTVKEDVEIFNFGQIARNIDAVDLEQLLCCNQHFVRPKKALGNLRANEYAVLR